MQLRRAKLVSDRSSVVKFFDRNIIVAMMYVFPSKPCKPRYVSLGLKMFNWFPISMSSRGWCECRALLVQDGANAMTPEKIQGATMPYG